MPKEKVRLMLWMLLTCIGSLVTMIYMIPIIDGKGISLELVLGDRIGVDGSGYISGNEETGTGSDVFSTQSMENYSALRSSGDKSTGTGRQGNDKQSETYAAINNAPVISNNSAGYTVVPGSTGVYASRNAVSPTNTASPLLQPQQGNEFLNKQHATAGQPNNTTALASGARPATTAIVEGVAKVGSAVKAVVVNARGGGGSNPPALPPDDGDPVDVPFDGGLTALLITGLAYGVKRMKGTEKKRIGHNAMSIQCPCKD
jgi:hypothetical protein